MQLKLETNLPVIFLTLLVIAIVVIGYLELKKIHEKFPNIIKEVRGKGLLIGLALHKDQTNFIKKLIDHKLLTVRAGENVVRLLPPLNVTKKEINLAIKIINNVCENYK